LDDPTSISPDMLLPAPGPSCLRFFTRESIEKLFRDAGYVIDTVKRTRLGLFDTEIEIDNGQVPKEVLDLIQADPESTTYQFVLTAYPQDTAHERHSSTNSPSRKATR
jgi:hypothetical protein